MAYGFLAVFRASTQYSWSRAVNTAHEHGYCVPTLELPAR